MNRSTLAVCGLAVVVYRQARRIQRLNTALKMVRAVHHEEMAASDEQIETLTVTCNVLRREANTLLDKRFNESPS